MALPTAGTGGEQDQFWPMPKFYFSVDIDDLTDLSFLEVSGLEVEADNISYRHGNDPSFGTIQMPGVKKSGNLILKKGVSYVEVIIECDSESIKEIIRVQTSDVDGDGVLDKDDQCIDVAGSIENEGCPLPDSDNDGVADKDDTCPNEAGALDNKGCPWPDSDSDGVADKDDRCPDEAGTVLNKGCPALPTQLVEFIESDQNLILFAINSAALDTEDKTTLEKIKVLLEEYPKTMITVEGYASKDGSESYNQKLSEERAAAVKAYFVSKNIDVQRINTLGFGENRTVGDNNTMLGRKNSRRAKIRLNIQ